MKELKDLILKEHITGPPEFLKLRRKARYWYHYLKSIGKESSFETPYGLYPDHFDF